MLFGNRIIFPFYHLISDGACPHIRHLYTVKSISQFEKELDFFQKNFQAISLQEILNHIKNNTKPERASFFLSFDDGLKECHTIIKPILKKRKLKAAFFLNTAFVNNQALFYRYKVSLLIEQLEKTNSNSDYSKNELLQIGYEDTEKINQIAGELNFDFKQYLETEKPYMDWAEIQELKADGFYIGAHSVDHPLYSRLSLEEQIYQTKKSIEEVENKLKTDNRIFSFPFTDDGVSSEFFKTIFDENIATLTFGTAGIKDDTYSRNLQRLPMDNCTNDIRIFVMKNFLAYYLKKLSGRQKVLHP